MDVIAELFPEPGLVFLHEAKATDPLGALPEIEMRHDQPRRPAVHRLERLVAEPGGDERLPLRRLVQRNIRRVAAIAVRHYVLAGRLHLDYLRQRVNTDAPPLPV